MTDISMASPIIASEMGPEFSLGQDVPGKITLRVGQGMTRTDDGNIILDVAFINSLLPDTPDGGNTLDRVTAIGFDPTDIANPILTLTIADGTQVMGGLPGVITEQRLAQEKVEVRSAFGTVLNWRALPV